MMGFRLFFASLVLLATACKAPAPNKPARHLWADGSVTALNIAPALSPRWVLGGGEIGIVGKIVDDKKAVKRGESFELTLIFTALRNVAAPLPKVFVHTTVEGGELSLKGYDHALPAFADGLSKGDRVEDRFTIKVPKNFPADEMQVRVGLYEGKHRWAVEKGEQDGANRVVIHRQRISDGPPAFPTVHAKKTTLPMAIDGVLDEEAWTKAQKIGPFATYSGRGRAKRPTTARILWDDDNLYLAFECRDPDVHTPYRDRDDPIYKSEAVEIFIDADGDRDEYVELQAAPNDVHFDAAFKGGRRKNFDTSYNVNYETRARVDGTINDPSDKDRGWVSEWRIPIRELRDIPEPPKVGTRWKINLFRLERPRKGHKIVGNEATAWSSPYSGDFHNLDRFGTLVFDDVVEKP